MSSSDVHIYIYADTCYAYMDVYIYIHTDTCYLQYSSSSTGPPNTDLQFYTIRDAG